MYNQNNYNKLCKLIMDFLVKCGQKKEAIPKLLEMTSHPTHLKSLHRVYIFVD